MASPSEYVRVGRLLVSTHQHPARLGWLLLTRGRPLLAVRGAARRSPVRRARELARSAQIAAAYARRRRGRGARLALPEPGDIAVATVSGHKVFDLHGSRVITLAPSSTPQEFREQVARAVAASACPLAPAVRSTDVERRRYEEEFLAGPPLLSLDAGLTRLDFYLGLLSVITSARPPESVRVGDYAARLAAAARAEVRRYGAGADPAAAAQGSAAAANEIDAFITDVLSALTAAADHQVQLGLSHGDLHGGNLCLVDGSPRVIDWQLSGARTLSYDLYVLLFRALFRRPDEDAVEIVRRASDRFAHRLRADGAPVDVSGWSRAAEDNRLLFYLEYLAPKRLGEPAIGGAGRLARLRDAVDTFRGLEWRAGTPLGQAMSGPPTPAARERRRSGLAKRTGTLPGAEAAASPDRLV